MSKIQITREALQAYILEKKIEQEIFTITRIKNEELESSIIAAEQLYVRMGFAEQDKRREERKNKTRKYRRIV